MRLCSTTFWKSSLFLLLACGLAFSWAKTVSASIVQSDVKYYYDFDAAGAYADEYFHGTSSQRLIKFETNGKHVNSIADGKFGQAIESPDNAGSSAAGACYYTHDASNTWYSSYSGGFSISAWYKATSTNSYGHLYSAESNQNYRVDLRPSNIYFTFYAGGWKDKTLGNYYNPDGVWHNVIIQGTWGSGASDSQLYIDGILVNSNWLGNDSPSNSGAGTFEIMGAYDGIDCQYALQGAIDDVAMFNRKLTSGEIAQIQTSSIGNIINPSEYCGDSVCQTTTETCANCPSDCGYCASASENLFYFYNPYTRNRLSTARISYLYNEAVFTPYDYLKIYQLDVVNPALSTFVGSSTVIDYNELGGQKQGGSSYFSLNGTSTYTGLIYYDIVAHFASYWDAGTATTVPESESIPWTLIVNWTDKSDLPLASWDFATTTVLGDEWNAHDMACTLAEWNATTTLGINPHLCSIKEWLLNIGVKPTVYIIGKITGLRAQIMGMFPFSLFKTVKDDWELEMNTLSFTKIALAEDTFSTSTGIYSGSSSDGYSIDIPNFIGGGTTTSIPIFSKTSFTNILGDYGFNVYYFICRFLIWALVLIFFWDLMTSRSKEVL